MDKKNQFSPQSLTAFLVFFLFSGMLLAQFLIPLVLAPFIVDMETTESLLHDPFLALLVFVVSQLCLFLMGFVVYLKVTKQNAKKVIHVSKINWKYVVFSVLGLIPLIFIAAGLGNLNDYLVGKINYLDFTEQEASLELWYSSIFNKEHLSYYPLFLLVSALLPAFVEELLFRGLLMRKLEILSGGKIHFAVWTSALIFTALHYQPWNLLPMIGIAGIFGYVYHFTKDIRYSMILHMLFNATTITTLTFLPEMAS